MSLAGKVVLVTGGFGVLGVAVTAAALKRGARVAQVDRLAALAAGDARLLVLGDVDLADEAAAAAAVDTILAAHGGIDVVLNVAGRFEWRVTADAGPEFWIALLHANVLAPLGAIRAVLPHLKPGAVVINVAAAAARRAGAGMGAYTAAKSGVLRLTEALAEELADQAIWVGSVSPTILDTPRNRADMPDADTAAWIAPAALAELLLDIAEGAGRGESGSDRVISG